MEGKTHVDEDKFKSDGETVVVVEKLASRQPTNISQLPLHVLCQILSAINPHDKLKNVSLVSHSFNLAVSQRKSWSLVKRVSFHKGGQQKMDDISELSLIVNLGADENINFEQHEKLMGLMTGLRSFGFMKSITKSAVRQQLVLNIVRKHLSTLSILNASLVRMKYNSFDCPDFQSFWMPLAELIAAHPKIFVRYQHIDYTETGPAPYAMTDVKHKWNKLLIQISALHVRLMCRDVNKIVADMDLQQDYARNDQLVPYCSTTVFVTDTNQQMIVDLISKLRLYSLRELHLVNCSHGPQNAFDFETLIDRLSDEKTMMVQKLRIHQVSVDLQPTLISKLLLKFLVLDQLDLTSYFNKVSLAVLTYIVLQIWSHVNLINVRPNFLLLMPFMPETELDTMVALLKHDLTATNMEDDVKEPLVIERRSIPNSGKQEVTIRRGVISLVCDFLSNPLTTNLYTITHPIVA